MKIVHLPYYDDNPYQRLMIEAQSQLGHNVLEGGGGGNFLGIALRKWKADVIHFHWLHPYLLEKSHTSSVCRSLRFIFEILVLRMTGSKIIWTIHNLANHEGHHHRIERFFTKIFIKLTHARIAHTATAAKDAAVHFNIPFESITIIPHGNFCSIYPNTINPNKAKETLQIKEHEHTFLFFGRINPYKGVSDLIKAFQKLSEPHYKLIVAGNPSSLSLTEEIQNLAANDSRILLRMERIPDAEVQVYFNAADVIVFPYKNILTSGALILAMSFGKAVIAPELAGIRDTLPVEGGDFFIPKDLESLTQSLRRSIKRDSKKAGKTNLDKSECWNWENIASLTIDTYQS